jgi:hypothetical protein
MWPAALAPRPNAAVNAWPGSSATPGRAPTASSTRTARSAAAADSPSRRLTEFPACATSGAACAATQTTPICAGHCSGLASLADASAPTAARGQLARQTGSRRAWPHGSRTSSPTRSCTPQPTSESGLPKCCGARRQPITADSSGSPSGLAFREARLTTPLRGGVVAPRQVVYRNSCQPVKPRRSGACWCVPFRDNPVPFRDRFAPKSSRFGTRDIPDNES